MTSDRSGDRPGTAARWPPGSLLGDLDQHEQERLLALGTPRRHDRGEVLLREGEPGRHVLVLLRGCTKVVSASRSREAVLLAVRVAGDVVGELSLLDGLPRAATVVVASPTLVVRHIDHRTFAAHLAARPVVGDALHRSVALKLRQASRFRSEVSGASAGVRLARVLLQLGTRYGEDLPTGRLIRLELTRVELADLVGASEASIGRELKKMRVDGLVQTGYRQTLLRDVAGLATLADDGRTA